MLAPMSTTVPAGTATTNLRAALRAEVGRLRRRESRVVFDSSVHVGVPGGERDSFVVRAQDRPALDVALRIDVLSRLIEDSPADWRAAWLVRAGALDLHDDDLRWFAAARTAYAIHDRTLDGFWVVTRSGWRDVVSDDRRVWKRLRLGPTAGAPGG
jgi:hypothetical protein